MCGRGEFEGDPIPCLSSAMQNLSRKINYILKKDFIVCEVAEYICAQRDKHMKHRENHKGRPGSETSLMICKRKQPDVTLRTSRAMRNILLFSHTVCGLL